MGEMMTKVRRKKSASADAKKSQDAGRSRQPSAGAVSPPFTSRDLYGTVSGRLQDVARVSGKLAIRFSERGDERAAFRWAMSAAHFGNKALAAAAEEAMYPGHTPEQGTMRLTGGESLR
jgi:hypothetical protein